MSIETKPGGSTGDSVVSVEVVLEGPLVARAGARRRRVLAEGRTVVDVVSAWADERGSSVRYALLEGDRLRSDVVATRSTDGANEPLTGRSRVRNGDTIRFAFRE